MSRTLDPISPASGVADLARTAPVRRWNVSRIAGGAVLAMWAGMFWFILLAHRVGLYLSTRTGWVVPVGAVLLTAAAVGRLASSRTRRAGPLVRRDAIVMGLMVLPVVLITVLPPQTLGTFSASKKAKYSSVNLSSIYGRITATSPITLLSIAAGQTSTQGSQALAKRAGSDVDFIGFVDTDSSTQADEFLLTRYVITCCVADATIVQVRVVNVTPGVASPNAWVEVKGQIYPIGREVILNAETVTPVPRPSDPYLTP
jgi:uncharacterized repeat protein (TIGR03943 family)